MEEQTIEQEQTVQENRQVEAQLEQLLENLQDWDQITADLPEVLRVNDHLMAEIQFSSDELTANQQAQLGQVVEQYQQIIAEVSQQKQAVLAKLRQLDRQKMVKQLPYRLKITGGGVIQLEY